MLHRRQSHCLGRDWVQVGHETLYLRRLFAVYAPNLRKYFGQKSPHETHHLFSWYCRESSAHLMHIRVFFEEKCSARRYSWGPVPTGRVWPAANPHQLLLHMLLVLSEQQIQVLCWRIFLFNGEKSNSMKLVIPHRTLQYHLSLSFDFLLMGTAFNY